MKPILLVPVAFAFALLSDPVAAFNREACEFLDQSDSRFAAACARPERPEKLSPRDRFKARVLERLRHSNTPPVARLEVFERRPGLRLAAGRVELDASGSNDEDGFVDYYTYQLFDADTDEILAGPVFSREATASLAVDHPLPANMRATLTVEDDERGTDTIDLALSGPDISCSNAQFTCWVGTSGRTNCSPTTSNIAFTTTDLLDAAVGCDATINTTTPLRIEAFGGGGGRGANVWPANGGEGGAMGMAAMGITLADLDSPFDPAGDGTTYCYGIGRQGSHGDTRSGSGGASTILQTCPTSATASTFVLIAGGGGGGGASSGSVGGSAGGRGGVAYSLWPDNMQCQPLGDCGDCGDVGQCGSNSTNAGSGDNGRDLGDNFGGGGGSEGFGGQNGSGSKGEDGFGGLGGQAKDTGVPGWIQGQPTVENNAGQGGSQVDIQGGAGGGGNGGGGSGSGNGPDTGGGGGGSVALQSTQSYDSLTPPTGSNQGSIVFTFGPNGI